MKLDIRSKILTVLKDSRLNLQDPRPFSFKMVGNIPSLRWEFTGLIFSPSKIKLILDENDQMSSKMTRNMVDNGHFT